MCAMFSLGEANLALSPPTHLPLNLKVYEFEFDWGGG